MIEDLCTDIANCRKLSYQIFFMINLNEKIKSDTMTEIFANVGLVEAITRLHSDTGFVTTYQRGSHIIDYIYISINIQVSDGGCLLFEIIPIISTPPLV